MPVWAESYNVFAMRSVVGVMAGRAASVFSGSEDTGSAIDIGPRTQGVFVGPNIIKRGENE